MTGSGEQTAGNLRIGKRLAVGLAGFAALIAFVTLTGYALGLVNVVRTRPQWQTMSVSSALLCILLAAALTADAFHRYRVTRRCGLAALAFSAVLLGNSLYSGHDQISGPLTTWVIGTWPIPNETSLASAFCLGLLGIGCLARPRAQPAAALAIAVMVVSGLATLGYTYGVKDLYALPPFRTMALRSALAFFALGLGFLLSNEQASFSALLLDRSVSGRSTRRQLGFLLIPLIAAWVLLKATSAAQMGPGAAMAFQVVLTVGPLAALILRDAKALLRLDEERQNRQHLDKAKLAVERRYHTLFDRLETAFCVIEMKYDASGHPVDYRFLETNPAFIHQTGLLDAEGQWMRTLAPAHEQHWFDIYGKVATTGEPIRFEQEAAALGRHYDVSAFPIDEPVLQHVAILFSDISDRKRSELDMKALNETLERRVTERAAELEQTQEALRQSQKLEAIGQLTGGVAHDFNNLLTVIRGSVDLLRRPNLTEERRGRFIDAIGETADRATKLTQQLLAFARRQSLRPETFDIGASLQELMTVVTTLLGAGVRLELNLAAQPCYVNADRSQFDTAIVNMVVNARDAMNGQGNIEITGRPAPNIPAVQTHPRVEGDFVAVMIRDTGSGISPDQLNRIFEPFFTTKNVGVGTGLGLSQVIGFAKQSGGDVRVESVVGEGSVFTLYLPREYAEPAKVVALAADRDVAGEGIRVLVVEDNAQVGTFSILSLAELGYEGTLASNAEAALTILAAERDRFDIVFSDVVMPGRSGIELGEDIRRLYPDLPVVLTSGYSDVLARTNDDGFELLHKPYSIEQLSRVLRKVLARADMDRNEPASAGT